MNIVRKDIDQNNATLTISIVKADYSEKVEKTLREYRKKANIPGFRPGNVPVSLVKKMYGKAIIADEINKLVSDELYKYIQENKVNILGEPLPNESEQKEIDFNTQEDFELTFDLAIAPEFEVELSKKDKLKYYEIAVNEEMIENQVKSFTSRYGKYVQEEIVEAKDMVKGEVLELAEGKVNEEGIKLSDAVLTPAYIKDEAQQKLFVGAKKGDVITINPAKAFQDDSEVGSFLKISKDEAKNVTSDFQFKIEGITRYHEAEINQELFDKIYGEGVVTTEEEFQNRIKASIADTLSGDSDYKFGVDARELLINKHNDLVFPDTFLKRWLLATNKNLTQETLDADYPKMIEDLKWQLIKNKVSKLSEKKIENSDIEEYAKKITKAQFAQYGMVGMDDELISSYAKDMLKKEDTLKSIIDRVAEDKVFEYVKENIKVENKEISIEDFNKLFE